MAERPPMVEGSELRCGIRLNSVTALEAADHRRQLALILDDMQAEYAEDLPVGLMFDTTDEDIVEDDGFRGVRRVLKIVSAS